MTFSLVIRAALTLTLLAGSFAFSGLAAANSNCDYSDAQRYDGWGWDPVARKSCPPVAEPPTGKCVDDDGDGWGWDGVKSCRPDTPPATCIDTPPANDGWGWDGTASCRLDVDDDDRLCIDSPPIGDGWGWNGVASCRISGSVKRLPSGGFVDDPEFVWESTGASSYRLVALDDRGDTMSREVSAQQAGCETAGSACKLKPDVELLDSILKWRVESYNASGDRTGVSSDVSFSTLRPLDVQPYNDVEVQGKPPNPGKGFPTLVYDNYVVLNNDWNAGAMFKDNWSQSVSVHRKRDGRAVVVFDYDWLGQFDGGEFEVKSYPQISYGNKLGTHVSGSKAETGLPERVRDLDEFRVDYAFVEQGNAERNMAFESFFHTSCAITGPTYKVDNREFEMMVWVASPTIRTPGGGKVAESVMIDNQLWDVWTKPEQNDEYIAFTAVNEALQGTLNWNRFVDWTVAWTAANPNSGIKVLDTNWCMGAIEFGVETFWGAGRLTINKFEVTRP